MVQLAERLSAIAPMPGPHKFYYGNSGAEAVEAALKLARYHTRRPWVIAFHGAFHGRTMGALSLTSSKVQQRRRFSPMLPGVVHVPFPNRYHHPEIDPLDYAYYIEDVVFRTEIPPEECAAIFVEPFQGEGGYLPAPTKFMCALREICDRHGILLVCDEVQSGCGRTGKWWAVQHTGVEPDMITVAKGIASGMPLGVLIARAELMDWEPGSHASTFGGNPVSIAAALATLTILSREGWLANVWGIGNSIMRRLNGQPEKHPMIGDVRGFGLMIGVEIVADRRNKMPSAFARDRILQLAFERGVLFLGAGESTIRICPPLVISQEQADYAMDVLEESIGICESDFHTT
jgi:4-aminobutyrate aminotransferase